MKPLPCPRCAAELTEQEIKSLFGRLMGRKDRPGSRGKKRPGIGGRKKIVLDNKPHAV